MNESVNGAEEKQTRMKTFVVSFHRFQRSPRLKTPVLFLAAPVAEGGSVFVKK